jgi:hypothetical protein
MIPGGQGKSRIAAWIALMALIVGKFDQVHLVFTNDVLLLKDSEPFEQLWKMGCVEDKIFHHPQMPDHQVSQGSLIIFDEADEHIYNNPHFFEKFVGDRKCVCLTATCGGTERAQAAEYEILKSLKFKVYEHFKEDESLNKPEFERIDLRDESQSWETVGALAEH